ncbi:MAG TPA: dihydroxyacetone kinase subunit DhaL [Acidimicrobiia bacterium]|nr:dihydroxyacetone kinase subunit DhaL [Acidimicrobiia bacterium]
MSRIAAVVTLDVGFARRWVSALAGAIEENCDALTRLDAAIGDADHGINMLRGMNAAVALLDSDSSPDEPAQILEMVGNRLVAVVGGAAGPLYGSAFRAMAAATAGKTALTPEDLIEALAAGLESIQRMGAAVPGDKTIVDSWWPAVRALRERSHTSLLAGLTAAEAAAREGMASTIPMRARKGRASYLGWRSEGHQDPGATSAHLVFSTLLTSATDQ